MTQSDRVFRALFVALAVGLGWGIRGDFGHWLGAMYPGAALGLGFAYVTGQKSMFTWIPLLGAIGGLGISTGGEMSYGLLHGYAKADTLINYAYGFFTLILQGGAWGCFGCALIGLALERERLKASELAAGTVTVLLSGFLFYITVVELIGFHINPDRSDASIAYTGGVIGLFIWLIYSNRRYGLQGAFFGYIGFGLGMATGRFLANVSYLQPYPVNHWNIMEVMCGFIGGFIFTYGMLGKKFEEPPEGEGYGLLNIYSIFYVMFLIPLLHRIRRIDPSEKLDQWAISLQAYGYPSPHTLSEAVLLLINIVCFFALLGVCFWGYLYWKRKTRWSAFPILYFSLMMLLIQNLNALYFFYPRQEGSINMHFVFWVMFALMLLFALLYPRSERTLPDEEVERVAWKKWITGGIAVYIVILILSAFVNGEETMKSANTRFPIWSWRDEVQ